MGGIHAGVGFGVFLEGQSELNPISASERKNNIPENDMRARELRVIISYGTVAHALSHRLSKKPNPSEMSENWTSI